MIGKPNLYLRPGAQMWVYDLNGIGVPTIQKCTRNWDFNNSPLVITWEMKFTARYHNTMKAAAISRSSLVINWYDDDENDYGLVLTMTEKCIYPFSKWLVIVPFQNHIRSTDRNLVPEPVFQMNGRQRIEYPNLGLIAK